VWQRFYYRFLKRPLLAGSESFMNVANNVLWMMAIILKANKVNLFVYSVLFVFWYHSPNVLDTPRMHSIYQYCMNSYRLINTHWRKLLRGQWLYLKPRGFLFSWKATNRRNILYNYHMHLVITLWIFISI
jgi:hypothetical protein